MHSHRFAGALLIVAWSTSGAVAGSELLLGSLNNSEVFRYDLTTCNVIATHNVAVPTGMVLQGDYAYVNNLYGSSPVVRYSLASGQWTSFTNGLLPGGNSLGLGFGPDGDLYRVHTQAAQSGVYRYDGQTGLVIGRFTVASWDDALFDLAFGPDGCLYLTTNDHDGLTHGQVERYDGNTGAYLGVFAALDENTEMRALVFGPDGDLYVTEGHSSDILRFNGQTGQFEGVFAHGAGHLTLADGLGFGPDGYLYVSGFGSNNVVRFDGTTGAFVDVFTAGGALDGPTHFVFVPEPDAAVLLLGPVVLIGGLLRRRWVVSGYHA